MTFARPDLLALAVVVPVLLALALWLYARRRRRIAAAFSDAHLLHRLGGAELLRFPATRFLLITLAGACLALAAAGPRWGTREAEGRSLSLNVVFAADISRSMLAEDVEPNRLERARLFARRVLRELPGDRFGLVVFAGRAYVLSPLTVDHSAIELYIDALDPNMVSQGGSSVAAALAQATDLARGSQPEGGDRIVVLLSDGEALEEPAGVIDAAERAARAGVRVLTVGFGSPRGATIPDVDPVTGSPSGVRVDQQGEVVVTRLDEELMRMIADRTNGRYVRADDAGAIGRVVAELRGMQRSTGESAARLEPRERFAIFAGLAVVLLALDALLVIRAARQRPFRMQQARSPGSDAAPRSRTSRTRTAAMVGLAAAVLGFGIGDLEKGNRMYREGRYAEAAEAYQRVLDSGKATPQVHYNLGTALLALGRHQEAERQFQAALQGVEPELRQRAFYNLGNRFLTEGRSERDNARQRQLLDAAIEAYRGALRIGPDDPDAKWNLELALRERDRNEQSSMAQQSDQDDQQEQDDQQQAQGGGSGASPQQSQAGSGQHDGLSQDQQPMTPEQAEQILSAMEQDERNLTREKLRRGQQRTPVLRDW